MCPFSERSEKVTMHWGKGQQTKRHAIIPLHELLRTSRTQEGVHLKGRT